MWLWVTVSAVVMIATYGFLFLGIITTTIQKTPRFFQSLNLRGVSAGVSAGAMRWNRILVEVLRWFLFEVLPLLVFYISLFAVILGLCAGLGIGLWKLYTSKLSAGTKVGISLGIFGGPPLLLPPLHVWYAPRRIRDYHGRILEVDLVHNY